MKKLSVIMIIIIAFLVMTACEGIVNPGDLTVPVDPMENTTWIRTSTNVEYRYVFDEDGSGNNWVWVYGSAPMIGGYTYEYDASSRTGIITYDVSGDSVNFSINEEFTGLVINGATGSVYYLQ